MIKDSTNSAIGSSMTAESEITQRTNVVARSRSLMSFEIDSFNATKSLPLKTENSISSKINLYNLFSDKYLRRVSYYFYVLVKEEKLETIAYQMIYLIKCMVPWNGLDEHVV